MDEQNYLLLQNQNEENYLIMNLLGYHHRSKGLTEVNEILMIKEEDRNSQKSVCHHQNTPNYKNIFDKEEGHHQMSQKLFQEKVEQNYLIIDTVTNKNVNITTAKKETKIDKIAYKLQTRKDKIQRYLRKKRRRIWSRKIFYDCRKVVADSRIRQNGRFAKKSPALSTANMYNSPDQLQIQLCLVKQQDLQGLDCQKFNLN